MNNGNQESPDKVTISREDWMQMLRDISEVYDWAHRDNLWAYQPDMGAPSGRRLLKPSGSRAAQALIRLSGIVSRECNNV